MLRKYSRRRVKEITKTKKTNQSGECHQPAKSAQSKGSNQSANKNKSKNKNSPVCPLHVPGHDMNSRKVMLAQAKGMKLTWLTVFGSGAGRIRLQGAKKRPNKGEKLNDLVANVVKTVFTTNKHKKAKALSDSGSEEEQENFNFETLKIGEEWQTACTPWSNDAEIPEEGIEVEKEL